MTRKIGNDPGNIDLNLIVTRQIKMGPYYAYQNNIVSYSLRNSVGGVDMNKFRDIVCWGICKINGKY